MCKELNLIKISHTNFMSNETKMHKQELGSFQPIIWNILVEDERFVYLCIPSHDSTIPEYLANR